MASTAAVTELVQANHVLATEEILNSYGHISRRNPDDDQEFLLSQSRSAALVSHEDIHRFSLDGEPVEPTDAKLFMERYIHSAIYALHPDVQCVIHAHTVAILPFAVSDIPLEPVVGGASRIGAVAPVWDIATKFGEDTNLLVMSQEVGKDLARAFGDGDCVLMRGHGLVIKGTSVLEAVRSAIEIRDNATVLLAARAAGGTVKPLHAGEIRTRKSFKFDSARGWQNWVNKAQ